MKNTLICCVLLTLFLSPRVNAQKAQELKLPTVGFNVRGRYTTDGAGSEGAYYGIEALLPLIQNPGKNVTFFQGRVVWLDNSYQNWNLLLGQRFVNKGRNEIWGGYVAYDTRQTSNKNYQQIGVGIERLGNDWDARINGYLPIGSTNKLLSESIGDLGFFRNFYGRVVNRRFEGALAGLDMEAGTRIARFGDGDVRLYGGLLYYTGEEIKPVFGARARLEARPTNNMLLGLTIQQDPLFDTSVILDLGLGFGIGNSRGQTAASSRKAPIAPRISEYVARNPLITVTNYNNRNPIEAAINPRTGKPYQFRHVLLGAGNGDGTYEKPAGTVQTVLRVAEADDIVYVDAGINPGVPSFKIPDSVSVLSTALTQSFDTVQYGRVTLPGSGNGRYPIVNGTVSMGNDTTLQGFDLRNIVGNGIDAANVRNVTIIDNRISNVTEQGISLNAVQGNNLVARNTISRTRNQGIFIQATGNNRQQVILDSNSVSNSGGQGIFSTASGSSIQQVNAVNTTVNGAKGAGIFFLTSGNSQQTATLENTQVSNTTIDAQGLGGQGIFLSSSGGGKQNITLNNTRISDTGAQGLFAEVSGDPQNPIIQSVQSLTFNQLLALRGSGQAIFVQATGNSRQEAFINRPEIRNFALDSRGEGGQGIFIAANNGAQQQFRVNSPNISDTAGQGIFVQSDSNAIQNFTIDTPTTTRNTGQGIFIRSGKGVQQEFNVNQPTVSNTIKDDKGEGGQGIFIATGEGAQQRFNLTNPSVSDTAGQGIFIAVNNVPGNTTQTQQTFTLTSPTVLRSREQGMFIQANGNVRQQFSITNGNINTVKSDGGQGGQGVFIQANQGANQSFTVDRVAVTNTANQGLFMQANGGAVSRYTFSNSSFTNAGNNNVFIQANQGGIMIGNYQSNRFENLSLPAFDASTNTNQYMCLALSGNSSNTGYNLQNNSGAFQLVNRDSVTTNNTGAFDFKPSLANFTNVSVCQ
ncbi:MAG: right-handed parallel beta-helix repeat-containing protein [Calothrix sp. C42_A2020_038]|nr:right-handed parallel beta-helix repeat-containing protein [Calothrix sp. C42_A2020_038]